MPLLIPPKIEVFRKSLVTIQSLQVINSDSHTFITPVNNDLSIFRTTSLISSSNRLDRMISPATSIGCSSMYFPPFITRLLDFWGFSFILSLFRATTVLCKTILEAGVEVVIKLTSSMKAWSTSNDLLFDRVHCGNPAQLTYFKITLNAANNKMTDMVHSANIPFSY